MIILAGILLMFLLIVFILSMSSGNKNRFEQEKELKELETKLISKRTELNSLEQQLQNKSINEESNLSNVVNEVLDIYEQSNIKIPVDIIEELQYMNLSDQKHVYDYIENQRNYWVLENRKKPYRKVV